MRRIALAGLALAVLAGTVLVAAGVGQGSPPHALSISSAARAREVRAVAHAGASTRTGERLFSSHCCNACHTIAAGSYDGRLGPRLDVQAQGNSISQIAMNITHPPQDDAGYEAGLMPENFGTRLSRHDLHALAVYIHTAAAAAAHKPSRHHRRHR